MNLQTCRKKREVKRVNGSKVMRVLVRSDNETDLQEKCIFERPSPTGKVAVADGLRKIRFSPTVIFLSTGFWLREKLRAVADGP
ncbi:hypothetical protein HanRHA438_Chr10g0431651 [Helianthus annuus]|nr:hypothetical protein HanRHA438_Chr10g0431651 [Helianthus annuus]